MISASFHRLAFVLLLAGGVTFAAEDKPEESEKKPGFFSRVTKGVTGLFTKDKPEAEKPAETPPPKPKASTPPKPKAATSKKSATPKKTTPPEKTKAKPAAKPTPEVAKKSEAPAKPAESKPAPATPPATPAVTKAPAEKTPKEAAKMKGDGGEFDDLSAAFGTPSKPEPAPVASSAKSTEPVTSTTEVLPAPPPLPASDGSWEVVKLGHDYITAESIQRFYRFSTLKRDGKTVWFRSPTIIMKAVIGSQDLMINNIKFVLSYPVTESKGKALISRLDLCKLLDPVLLPSHITSSEPFDTVVIDAGHGGHDSGAKGVYGYEKDFTLQMATVLRDECTKRGFKTVMTRSTDKFITLGDRVAIANSTPRSIFVSLHFNSSNSGATGIETWALTPAGSASTFMGSRGWDNAAFQGNHRDSENIALATAVHGMVIHRFKLVDRGIKRARWSVLTGCNRPGILFEGGFVTNGTECRLIASPTYRSAIAQSIGDAIVNYRRALQPRVVQPSVR